MRPLCRSTMPRAIASPNPNSMSTFFGSLERFEDVRQHIRRDTSTVVAYLDLNIPVIAAQPCFEPEAPAPAA